MGKNAKRRTVMTSPRLRVRRHTQVDGGMWAVKRWKFMKRLVLF